MSVADVISLLGGIALFLFGMSLMGEGLKKVAGSRLELVLYKLTQHTAEGRAAGHRRYRRDPVLLRHLCDGGGLRQLRHDEGASRPSA